MGPSKKTSNEALIKKDKLMANNINIKGVSSFFLIFRKCKYIQYNHKKKIGTPKRANIVM